MSQMRPMAHFALCTARAFRLCYETQAFLTVYVGGTVAYEFVCNVKEVHLLRLDDYG